MKAKSKSHQKAVEPKANRTRTRNRQRGGGANPHDNMKLLDDLAGVLGGNRISLPPPGREYEEMYLGDLCCRIIEDMSELSARVSVDHEEFTRKHVSAWHKDSQADPRNAVSALLFATTRGVEILENLSAKHGKFVQDVAKRHDRWPVNLGVEKRFRRTNQGQSTVSFQIKGQKPTADYLKRLKLGTACDCVSTEAYTGAFEQSPFRVAAQLIQQALVNRKSVFGLPRLGMTRWQKKLVALPEPMTKANWHQWWVVVKVRLDEQWKSKPEVFEPLIRHLNLVKSTYKPHMIKRRVIDDSLKKAFRALATPIDE